VGSGGLTASIDAYGDVVDLRLPGPAGRALIENPAERQAAGTVAAATGIVPRLRIGGVAQPLWRADSVAQHYRRGTNVLVTEARFGPTRVEISYAAAGDRLVCLTRSTGPELTLTAHDPGAAARLRCGGAAARRLVRAAGERERRWLSRARPLGTGAPPWAQSLYERSLLTLLASTDRRTGAVAAGARDGWAYVWPRDAATAALAFAAAGYRPEARRVAGFLGGLDLAAAARFAGDGSPVPGRAAQGDASGWVALAARTAGLPPPRALPWRDRADYQEGARGDYLANAIAARADTAAFETSRGLVRRAGDPASGLDSAAAWGVQPFPQPALFPAVRRTLLQLAAGSTRFGIVPGAGWSGTDPWTAPTAWTAWALAALSDRERRFGAVGQAEYDRHGALTLLVDLRRAATPAGALPERVDTRSGVPRSTTPLTWSHAFAILALRQLWPSRERASG
jgi:hypothetical protein